LVLVVAAAAAAASLQSNVVLEVLLLAGNDIGEDGARHLITALAANSSLKFLGLNGSNLTGGQTGFVSICKPECIWQQCHQYGSSGRTAAAQAALQLLTNQQVVLLCFASHLGVGECAAISLHLDDMRCVCFSQVGKPYLLAF
jgi:hypothetical protein